jgi:hypothetical protein
MFCFSLCVFVLFCALFLIVYIVFSFRFVYKFTDYCDRVESQLQLINIISHEKCMWWCNTWRGITTLRTEVGLIYFIGVDTIYGYTTLDWGYQNLYGVTPYFGCNTFYGVSALKLPCFLVRSSIFDPVSFLLSKFWMPSFQLTLVRFMSFLPLFSIKTLVFLSFWKHGFCPFSSSC